MRYYLNNWQNKDHSRIFGCSAIFDLWADGTEHRRAQELAHGDNCLVLSRADKVNVAVNLYVFTAAKRGPNDPTTNRGVWVLEGMLLRREVLPKSEAVRHLDYSRFFNKFGHVNHWSILADA